MTIFSSRSFLLPWRTSADGCLHDPLIFNVFQRSIVDRHSVSGGSFESIGMPVDEPLTASASTVMIPAANEYYEPAWIHTLPLKYRTPRP
jgi:hypothetical protein